MDNNSTTSDVLNFGEQTKPTLPSGLNVLTILTFIGCAIGGLFSLFMPAYINFMYKFMDKATSSGQDLSAKQLADIEKGKAALDLLKTHLIPTIILSILGVVLCLLGAIWMRKLKKDGYWLYVAGELAPLIAGFFILGSAQYTSAWSYIFGIGIPLTFVILYTLQRKYLVN